MRKYRKWTKEKCKEIAKNYNTIKEFSKDYSAAYQLIRRRGWFNEVCSHLKRSGSYSNRLIYSYEFEDKSVYVGLTCNLKRRHSEHLTNSKDTVYKYINENHIEYQLIQKTEFIDYIEASKQEGEILEEYIKQGWKPLNIIKTGGLGGTIKIKQKKEPIKRTVNGTILNFWDEKYWTEEKCKEEALKYQTKSDFYKKSSSAYNSAHKLKILDKICSHMKPKCEYWTKELALEEVKKYTTKQEFKTKSPKCYRKCSRMKWLQEVEKDLIDMNEINTIHTYENAKKIVQNYKTLNELSKSNDIFVRGTLSWIKRKKLQNEFRKFLKQ